MAGGDKRGMTADWLYSCFDFCLRSEIPLPDLLPIDDANERPIVEIRCGPVPEVLPGASPAILGVQVTRDTALLAVQDTARFLVRGGQEIQVDATPGGSERNVRLFLLGSALGILCHQRGLLPLHANAIVANGGAYAFAGHSGAGKSTLAAHFSRAGYPVLCDDVCIVSFDGGGTPIAWPGLPRLKLWGDAVQTFGHDKASLERAVDGLDKFHVPMDNSALRPAPLRRLYVLARTGEGEVPAVRRLRGHQAMAAAMAQTYRSGYLAPLGLVGRNFRQCAALLARTELYEARRDWGYESFDRAGAMLEEHVLQAV